MVTSGTPKAVPVFGCSFIASIDLINDILANLPPMRVAYNSSGTSYQIYLSLGLRGAHLCLSVLPAGFVSDIRFDGQSREEDPDGGADQAVQSEGGQNRQNGEGAHCLDEA